MGFGIILTFGDRIGPRAKSPGFKASTPLEGGMTEVKNEVLSPIEIPAEALSSEALLGVIDNFIQREGTDYGLHEASYEAKVQQVQKQLSKGYVRIVFDPNSETVSLVTEAEWKKLQKSLNAMT